MALIRQLSVLAIVWSFSVVGADIHGPIPTGPVPGAAVLAPFNPCGYCRQINDLGCVIRNCLGIGFPELSAIYNLLDEVELYHPGTVSRPVNICAYCREIQDQDCIQQHCLGGSAPPDYIFDLDELFDDLLTSRPRICAYCRQIGDKACIIEHCLGEYRPVDGIFSNNALTARGSDSSPANICEFCRATGDQQCITKFCLGGFYALMSRELMLANDEFSTRGEDMFPVNLCAYCREIGDQQCIAKHCLGGNLFRFNLCAYCREIGDQQCIAKHCLGGNLFPYNLCAYCREIGDQQCIAKHCLGGNFAALPTAPTFYNNRRGRYLQAGTNLPIAPSQQQLGPISSRRDYRRQITQRTENMKPKRKIY